MTKPQLEPLDEVAAANYACVRELRGGAAFVSRLAGVGIVADTVLEVLQNHRHGPVLVKAHGERVALGRNEAARVLVEVAHAVSAAD